MNKKSANPHKKCLKVDFNSFWIQLKITQLQKLIKSDYHYPPAQTWNFTTRRPLILRDVLCLGLHDEDSGVGCVRLCGARFRPSRDSVASTSSHEWLLVSYQCKCYTVIFLFCTIFLDSVCKYRLVLLMMDGTNFTFDWVLYFYVFIGTLLKVTFLNILLCLWN